MAIKSSTVIAVFLVLALAGDICAGTYLTIGIDLDKTRYALNEPVTGKVILHNSVPATVTSDFRVTLYKDGRVIRELTVNVPVFTGTTKLDIQNFGLRGLETVPGTPGQWLVVIEGGGNPPARAEAEFSVSGSPGKR